MTWVVCDPCDTEAAAFLTIDACMGLEGEIVNSNSMSTLRKVQVENRTYFLKIYHRRGKGLRRFIGRSRARAEWENLQLFKDLCVPTARLVAYGEQQNTGIIITGEVSGTVDLVNLAENHPKGLARHCVEKIIDRLTMHVRNLHSHGFIHNDLKWRNILVGITGNAVEVYIIDCPQGRKLVGPLFRRGVLKDLACLDIVAKYRLSKTMRMRFYLKYREQDRLNTREKREIYKILHFLDGK